MTILEATRTGDNAFAAPEKAFVVKSGAGYRAEQGSDYEPGVSAETVGSKSIWLGRITLPCPSSNALRQFTALLSGGSSSPVGLS
jgi:uncharacterized RmlC-like cupin family protein